MRFIHQRRHLGGRELWRVHLIRKRKHTARDCGLDYVRAISHLKTNGFAHGIGPIGDSIRYIRFRPEKSVAKSGSFVEMAAGRADAIGGDEHARSDNNSFRNRVAPLNSKE